MQQTRHRRPFLHAKAYKEAVTAKVFGVAASYDHIFTSKSLSRFLPPDDTCHRTDTEMGNRKTFSDKG